MTLRRVLAALALLSLSACSAKAPSTGANDPTPDSAADRSDSASVHTPPPIHYDQTSVLTGSGELMGEKNYRFLLDACHKAAPAYPIHPLTDGEVEKLDRQHVEAWIGPDKASRHEDRWKLGVQVEHPCQFSLDHEVDETEISESSGRTTLIDNVAHKVDVQDVGPWAPVTPMPPENGEITEGERLTGWTKIGASNANGAPCAIWQDQFGSQLCVWTGGGEWGYSADGPTALHDGMSRGDAIVLWVHPGKGPSWKLDTKEFSVGKALDQRAFQIPENATHAN